MRLPLMKLDKLEGNVDSLSNRIANVRTWSYVSNKNNWIENKTIGLKTKFLEDKLQIDFMKNLLKHLLINEQVYLQED